MRKYNSPGIEYSESEKKAIGSPIIPSVSAIIGFASKGPFEPTEIKSVLELHNIFGSAYLGKNDAGVDSYSKAIVAAERVLQYSDKILFCRLPLDDGELDRFHVDADEVSFDIANYDTTVSTVELRQNVDKSGLVNTYTYDMLIHYSDDSVKMVAEGVYLADLEKAVASDGSIENLSVDMDEFPIDLPPETISEINLITDGASENEKSISFEIADLPVTKSKTLSFTSPYDPTIDSYSTEDDAVKFIVTQAEHRTEDVFNFTEAGGWKDDSGTFEITVVQPAEIVSHEYVFDSDNWAGVDDAIHADGKHVFKFHQAYTRVTTKTFTFTSAGVFSFDEFSGTVNATPTGSSDLVSMKIDERTDTYGIREYQITFTFADTSTKQSSWLSFMSAVKNYMETTCYPNVAESTANRIYTNSTLSYTDHFPIKQDSTTYNTYYSIVLDKTGTNEYSLSYKATSSSTKTLVIDGITGSEVSLILPQYHLGIQVSTKSGMTYRNFPIWQTPYNQISKFVIEEVDSSSYRSYYYKQEDGYISTNYIPSSGFPCSATALMQAVVDSGVFTVVSHFSSGRNYPIHQEDLISYTSLTITELNGVYSLTANKNGIISNIVTGVLKGTFESYVNTSGKFTIVPKVSTDSANYPIYQGVLPNFLYLRTEKIGDNNYTVYINNSGTETSLVASTTAENFITALGNATITVAAGTYKPLTNIVQNTSGVDFPIIQLEKSSSKYYDIGANVFRTKYDVDTIREVTGTLSNTDVYYISSVIAPIGNLVEQDLTIKVSDKRLSDQIDIVYNYINNALVDLCTQRGDCIACLDYPSGSAIYKVKEFFENYDTAFACTCYPSSIYKSPYLEVPLVLPPSVMMVTQFAYTDSVSECWFAPAGYGNDRGVVSGAYAVSCSLSKAERDDIYSYGINPVIRNNNSVVVIYGNRTLKNIPDYEEPSDFSYLNIRRLCNYIRSIVVQLSMNIVFEPNDAMSWDNWKNSIRPYLRYIKDNRGIEDFKIVMDRSTISDEDIVNGRAPGVIYVKPVYAIEYISIEFVMTQDSVIFDEEE